jgi:stringent starvation protein B
MSQNPPSLPDLVGDALAKGMITVQLDARMLNVAVPEKLAAEGQLKLNLSMEFANPPVLEDWGIKAMLTFDGVATECRLPWESIYVLYSHGDKQVLTFPMNMPEDMREQG